MPVKTERFGELIQKLSKLGEKFEPIKVQVSLSARRLQYEVVEIQGKGSVVDIFCVTGADGNYVTYSFFTTPYGVVLEVLDLQNESNFTLIKTEDQISELFLQLEEEKGDLSNQKQMLLVAFRAEVASMNEAIAARMW
jgi:hypothetical protein